VPQLNRLSRSTGVDCPSHRARAFLPSSHERTPPFAPVFADAEPPALLSRRRLYQCSISVNPPAINTETRKQRSGISVTSAIIILNARICLGNRFSRRFPSARPFKAIRVAAAPNFSRTILKCLHDIMLIAKVFVSVFFLFTWRGSNGQWN
jgi:hypothetical protein